MKKKEKENKNRKLWMIVGVIAFALYMIMYLIGRASTMIMYHIPVSSQILGILKVLLLNSFLCVYIILSSKKSNKVLNILLLIVFFLFLISNLVDVFNDLRILLHYGGNKIYYVGIICRQFIAILLYIILCIMSFGLIINKKIAPKVFLIISFILVGILLLSSIGVNIAGMIYGMNIRNLLNTLSGFLQAIFFAGFQASYIGMMYENTKEIK